MVYSEGDPASFVLDELGRLGPAAFAEIFNSPLDTAKKLGSDRRPSSATVRTVLAALRNADTSRVCALDGCNAPVCRSNARYCCTAHQRTDGKRRARVRANANLPERHLRRRTRRRNSV